MKEYYSVTIGAFIRDRCLRKKGARVRRAALWSAYIGWCSKTGWQPESAIMLGRHLRSDGIGEVNGRRGREWIGLALKEV